MKRNLTKPGLSKIHECIRPGCLQKSHCQDWFLCRLQLDFWHWLSRGHCQDGPRYPGVNATSGNSTGRDFDQNSRIESRPLVWSQEQGRFFPNCKILARGSSNFSFLKKKLYFIFNWRIVVLQYCDGSHSSDFSKEKYKIQVPPLRESARGWFYPPERRDLKFCRCRYQIWSSHFGHVTLLEDFSIYKGPRSWSK